MKYYVSQTTVELDAAGRISGYESVLTKPDTRRAAENSLRRLTALGIEHLHLCKHPENSRRWGKLNRAANKRIKTRKLTVADLAEDIAEIEKARCKEVNSEANDL